MFLQTCVHRGGCWHNRARLECVILSTLVGAGKPWCKFVLAWGSFFSFWFPLFLDDISYKSTQATCCSRMPEGTGRAHVQLHQICGRRYVLFLRAGQLRSSIYHYAVSKYHLCSLWAQNGNFPTGGWLMQKQSLSSYAALAVCLCVAWPHQSVSARNCLKSCFLTRDRAALRATSKWECGLYGDVVPKKRRVC